MCTDLPPHARVISAPDLWMEGSAISQLGRVARFEGCTHAVGMPDLHAGPGIPIGAALAFDDIVRPLLVGGDAGCGVTLVGVPRWRGKVDSLVRKVDLGLTGPALPEVDPGLALAAVWTQGPRGLSRVDGVPHSLAELVEQWPDVDPTDAGPPPPFPMLGAALGTIGGGNHFAEVSRVVGVVDRSEAGEMGLSSRGLAVMVHSGSRGLGRWLIDGWGDAVLRGQAVVPYLQQLAGAVRFAQANRAVLIWRMLDAVGAVRSSKRGPLVDIVHNTVVQTILDDSSRWVHRKGSAPAHIGQPTVLLGSRGTPSHVLVGQGNPACLHSIAHGAGRKMARTEARDKLRTRYRRKSLSHTKLGGRVLCDNADLLYQEHPDVYKPVGPVLQATLASGAARHVCALHPLVTVKR